VASYQLPAPFLIILNAATREKGRLGGRKDREEGVTDEKTIYIDPEEKETEEWQTNPVGNSCYNPATMDTLVNRKF